MTSMKNDVGVASVALFVSFLCVCGVHFVVHNFCFSFSVNGNYVYFEFFKQFHVKTSHLMEDEKAQQIARKCIILDIDGTLIDSICADEDKHYDSKKSCIKNAENVNNKRQQHFIFNFCDSEHVVHCRPYLEYFMKYLFSNEHIDHVAIWSAAGSSWIEDVVFKYCESVSKYRDKYSFIWDDDRISRRHASKTLTWNSCTDYVSYHKPLSKVWRSKYRKSTLGFNKYNTIIIEDTPSNCVDNYGNAIYVESFESFIKLPKIDEALCKDIENESKEDEKHSNENENQGNQDVFCENDKDDYLYYLTKYLDYLLTVPNVRKIDKRDWYVSTKFDLD